MFWFCCVLLFRRGLSGLHCCSVSSARCQKNKLVLIHGHKCLEVSCDYSCRIPVAALSVFVSVSGISFLRGHGWLNRGLVVVRVPIQKQKDKILQPFFFLSDFVVFVVVVLKGVFVRAIGIVVRTEALCVETY